jgi:hypothetical protein
MPQQAAAGTGETEMRRMLMGAMLALVLGAGQAMAARIEFRTPLTPEVAGATGSGNAYVAFDPVANTMRIQFSYSGLSGVTTVAHIHCCIASPGTVVVAVQAPSLPDFVTGVSAGSYDRMFDLTSTAIYGGAFLSGAGGTAAGAEAALLAGLLSGQAYLNVHSNTFPRGEIRGFFTQVPEPATAALLGSALLGFAALRRRRAQG